MRRRSPYLLRAGARYGSIQVLLILFVMALALWFMLQVEAPPLVSLGVILSSGALFWALYQASFNSLVETIKVDEVGITHYAWGKTVFDCSWDEVLEYECDSGGEDWLTNLELVNTYTVHATRAPLKFTTFKTYFPCLHSMILTHMPERAGRLLKIRVVPQGEPVNAMQTFGGRTRGGTARSLPILLMLIFILAFGVFGFITQFGTENIQDYSTFLLAMIPFIGIFFIFLVPLLKSNADGYNLRISPQGVELMANEKRALVGIKWEDLLTVEPLYGWSHYEDESTRRDRGVEWGYTPTPPTIYTYALIGRHGDYITFRSGMQDFGAFVHALARHAQPHTAINLHKDISAIHPR